MRTLSEWLALQESVHARSVDLGLERVARVAAELGIPRHPWPAILVGGTNGKGSTVAHLEALLLTLDTRVGVFTSPHLRRYNERIRVAGSEVSDAELVAAFERIEVARGATTLTFFEYNTLAAFEIFGRERVAIGVVEVGLGGRLDATNILDADVSIVCSIGRDHTDWLGETLEEIGREKAGIFRPGRPAILGSAEMPGSVLTEIERVGAIAWIAGRDFRIEHTGEGWSYHGPGLVLQDLPRSSLAGAVQFENAATALAALETLGLAPRLTDEVVARALTRVRLPGRLQIVPGDVEWILDVAHNAPAAARLASELAARPHAGRTLAVAGILRDKDAAAIGSALAAEIDGWVLCTLPGARGETAAALAQRLVPTAPVIALAEDVPSGCRIARDAARPGDRIVVFGSFHTVGPALDWLGL